MPTPVAAPRLLAHSREMAQQLGLAERDLCSTQWVEAMAGNALLPGMTSYATCYGGHQFGNWARQLGDGRAIFLGETINSTGQRFELQLKGAGAVSYTHLDVYKRQLPNNRPKTALSPTRWRLSGALRRSSSAPGAARNSAPRTLPPGPVGRRCRRLSAGNCMKSNQRSSSIRDLSLIHI